MNIDRVALLEQKLTVLQREISEVLQEMQVTMQGLTVTYGTALKVMDARLKELEDNSDKSSNTLREDSQDGKEL